MQVFFRSIFYNHVNKAKLSESIQLAVNSVTSDIVAGVTRGKTLILKYFLLALGILSYTGQRKPVEILNCLGHCISYKTTSEIEIAQAVKA